MKNNLEIGARIRAIREELHMNRNLFSEKINISESYLTQLELGNKSIGLNCLISISEYTGYSTDYILFGNCENNETDKKISKIIRDMTDDNLQLIYEIVRSIKAHSDT